MIKSQSPDYSERSQPLREYGPFTTTLADEDQPVVCLQQQAVVVGKADHRNGDSVIMLAMGPSIGSPSPFGAYFAMDPESARMVAASIIDMANLIDGRKSMQ